MKTKREIILILCAAFSALILISSGMSGCKKEEKAKQDKPAALSGEKSDEKSMTVTVYAYCPCAKCNTEEWKGMVSTGQKMSVILADGKNICAADPDLIPLGSIVTYDGMKYLVSDTGSKIKGKTINILMKTHKEVYAFGVKKDQTITIEKGN